MGASGGSAGSGVAGSTSGTGGVGTSGSSGSGATSGSGTSGSATGGSGTSGSATGGSATGGSGTGGGGTGTSGSAGAAGGGGTGSPCAIPGKILCDDFESEAAGSLPTGSPWIAPNCNGSVYTLKVDGTVAHSGTHSLVGEGAPYADCELRADLGASLSEYWVRAWAYYAEAAPDTNTHEVAVFELVPVGGNAADPGGSDDPSIRVGYRGNTCMPIGVEVNITGGGQEETGCSGATPVANTWYCYVLHVTQAATSVTADLSINGVDQSYMNHGNAQMQITSQVAGVRYLRLGTRSYSGTWAHPIYVDDVAVATQALGCN
jgi:hypothetical protein